SLRDYSSRRIWVRTLPACVPRSRRLLPSVGLRQSAVDEDAILLWSQSGEKQFPLLFDHDLVSFLIAYGELVSLRQAEREHPKVFHHRLTIDANLQVADHLIEREINLLLFAGADYEAARHGLTSIVDQ